MIEVLGNPKYKRIYLAGPITDLPNLNKEEFKKYEEKFLNLNFEVINPHNLFTKEEIDKIDKELEDGKINKDEHWAFFMKKCIPEMIKSDLIAMLPKWEKSKGANLEVYNARSLYMPIVDAINLQELF